MGVLSRSRTSEWLDRPQWHLDVVLRPAVLWWTMLGHGGVLTAAMALNILVICWNKTESSLQDHLIESSSKLTQRSLPLPQTQTPGTVDLHRNAIALAYGLNLEYLQASSLSVPLAMLARGVCCDVVSVSRSGSAARGLPRPTPDLTCAHWPAG